VHVDFARRTADSKYEIKDITVTRQPRGRKHSITCEILRKFSLKQCLPTWKKLLQKR